MIRAFDIESTTGKPYYELCDACNYDRHTCHFCGENLSHDGFQSDGIEHTVAYCRPDLVAHEPGPLCTWPATGDVEFDAKFNRPGCYWDHEKGELKP